ncbi:MAG: alpha/beta hydrolase fold domain-containing protein [Dermatophilaceae bacterium]
MTWPMLVGTPTDDDARLGRLARWAVAVLLVVGTVAACGSSGDTGAAGSPSQSANATDAPAGVLPGSTAEFLPGLDATLVLPTESAGGVPLVVLVPGGGWASADPSGLAPLAHDLASRGAAVVMLTYRTAADGAFFPVPVHDVACGVGYAAGVLHAEGVEGSPVVIVGHSAGAHLAALVALAPDTFADPACPYAAVAPTALVGLAGPYDITGIGPLAANLFGPDRPDPMTWLDGNPLILNDRRPDLPVLLVHGTADTLVPVSFTDDFAAALRRGGHDVTTVYPDGVTHDTVYSAEVAAPIIADWLAAITPAPPPAPRTVANALTAVQHRH